MCYTVMFGVLVSYLIIETYIYTLIRCLCMFPLSQTTSHLKVSLYWKECINCNNLMLPGEDPPALHPRACNAHWLPFAMNRIVTVHAISQKDASNFGSDCTTEVSLIMYTNFGQHTSHSTIRTHIELINCTGAVFLYFFSDCPSFLIHLNNIGWAF